MTARILSALRTLGEVPWAVWLVAGSVVACAALPTPKRTGDHLRDLRVAVTHAEAGLPLARLGCQQIHHTDERAACMGVADRIEAALPRARATLAQAEACAGQDDEPACIELAVAGVNALLRELQGQPADAPDAGHDAPAGSAHP